MTAQELLAEAPYWIRQTFAQRGGKYGFHARQCCKEWIRLLRWARVEQSEGRA